MAEIVFSWGGGGGGGGGGRGGGGGGGGGGLSEIKCIYMSIVNTTMTMGRYKFIITK
jgi:hypothetical protein